MFPANFLVEIPSANVIQDVNIRLFYDSVAEIMGHTYQTFIMHTILHTIPATNAIAVLWLADPSDFAQRVLMANSRTRIAARLGIINLREAPITTALGDCADSIRFLLPTPLYPVFGRRLCPGDEILVYTGFMTRGFAFLFDNYSYLTFLEFDNVGEVEDPGHDESSPRSTSCPSPFFTGTFFTGTFFAIIMCTPPIMMP